VAFVSPFATEKASSELVALMLQRGQRRQARLAVFAIPYWNWKVTSGARRISFLEGFLAYQAAS